MPKNYFKPLMRVKCPSFKEMKKIKGGSKSGQSVPDCVDGVDGHEAIVEQFKYVYETLYNSAETSEGMNVIKDNLKAMIGPESIE